LNCIQIYNVGASTAPSVTFRKLYWLKLTSKDNKNNFLRDDITDSHVIASTNHCRLYAGVRPFLAHDAHSVNRLFVSYPK